MTGEQILEALRAERERRKMSIRTLAARSDVPVGTLSHYMRHDGAPRTLSHIVAVANALGLEVSLWRTEHAGDDR